MNKYAERIERLRSMMRSRGWDAVVITGSDPHSSEYPAQRWKQVEWLTGFTGEAGDVVVTADHAGLWTDTRYFIQAVKQLDGSGAVLHKTRVPEQVLIPEWLASQGEELTVAVDSLCQSVDSVRSLEKAARCNVVGVPDLLSPLWEDRPSVPSSPVMTLGEDLVGESRESKLDALRRFLLRQGCDGILLSSLDEIAWLLNVRGSDIEYNPLVMSYLLVTMESAFWYVLKDNAPDDETADSIYEVEADDVRVLPYDDITTALALPDDFGVEKLFLDPSTLNYHLYSVLLASVSAPEICQGPSPVPLRKAVKNEREIEGMREAHLEDGLAMEKFLWWLETSVSSGARITEADAARYLGKLRSDIPGYRGDSFETISAYGEGAALPHYVTPRHDAPVLKPYGLYLVDSGGQYLFGTTDITRTVPLGPCSELEREDYTLVLKGHIGLARAIFPEGTAGCQIDALARDPLWKAYRNFGHGTGHGVGFYLCVHEGPQDVRQNFNSQPLLPGMILSDEPGLYREGMHGVRHENLVLVVPDGESEFGRWLRFETLTLCHFDTSAIIPSLLSKEETSWLNDYNEQVYRILSPRLPSEVASWLREKTRAI